MNANRSFITVEGLTKRYGQATVLDGVGFGVAEGEFLTFLGPSGCGKTTTLRCIAGFIQPDGGKILVDGSDLTRVAPHQRNLGMVFQNYALFPHMSVFDNVGFGLDIRNVSKAEAQKRIVAALDMVRLGGLGERYPKQLSGGQQQRVALARALVYQPRMLLLDEPLSNLDAKLRVEMRSEIRNLQQRFGITALYVTHDQEEALSVSDRVMVMNKGKIEQLSTPWELYNRPQTAFVASFVGTSNLLPAKLEPTLGMLRVAEAFHVPSTLGSGHSDSLLVVRPENIELLPAASAAGDNAGTVQGVIQSITLLGATHRVELSIASGTILTIDQPHGGQMSSFNVGDRAVAKFDLSRITPIPAA